MASLRQGIPGWMLRHRCTVEPYEQWGVYGPARTLTCFIQENLASAGPTGTERLAQITIYCRLGENVPPGSRIQLVDGRRGYAHATVRQDGGGLPTPDHLQIAMSLAGAYGPAYGEPVIILYRTTTRDDAGAARYTWRRDTVQGAAVRLLNSAESAVGTAESVAETVEVVFPPGTPVSTRDRLEVRGLVYDVDGTPTEVTDPQTTARPGVKVIGKRRQT